MQTSPAQRSGRPREYDLAGCALLIFGGLNLNGLFLMFIKELALLSPLVLVFVLVLWLRYTRPVAVSELLVLFMAFMVSFLASATVISLINGSFETTYLTIYTATLLLIPGVYFWLFGCTDVEFEKVLRLFKGILLIACALVPFSPYIAPYLDVKGPEGRATGLFGSPNDAGVAALYCLVLITAYPAKSRLVTAIHVAIALVALALTFSKAGILCLGLLTMFILVERRSVKLILLAIVAFAIAGIALQYLFDHDLFSLSREQRERIADVLNLAGGEISMRATTGRTVMWETGIWRIEDQLPFGSGLGSFHSLEGGSRGDLQVWLGVHNTFLMIIGEAGLIPFAIFITFLTRTVHHRRSGKGPLGGGWLWSCLRGRHAFKPQHICFQIVECGACHRDRRRCARSVQAKAGGGAGSDRLLPHDAPASPDRRTLGAGRFASVHVMKHCRISPALAGEPAIAGARGTVC